ncbi:hypothetical protein QG37_02720 [Candidozyma auris]|uniref:Uncharacterized protein n=1 Tax=Candidozyma auris TaxID=498019 RepID=A0A0L0P1P3_CANAR|nr:hypothetical protein QG37_02720 [[Candida] auris]
MDIVEVVVAYRELALVQDVDGENQWVHRRWCPSWYTEKVGEFIFYFFFFFFISIP